MSVVAELEASLEALKALKPPGVTKSRISTITQLCIENVKDESVLVQKLYTSFKRTPGTHKLGVLYAIDNVARQWMDKATAAGQKLNGTVQDGTYAAGVRRVTELLPAMMNDLVASAPDDQRDKIFKLVDIWERGSIFESAMVSDFKARLNKRNWNVSTTPPGSPPSLASIIPSSAAVSTGAVGAPTHTANATTAPTMAPTTAQQSAVDLLSSLAMLGQPQQVPQPQQPAATYNAPYTAPYNAPSNAPNGASYPTPATATADTGAVQSTELIRLIGLLAPVLPAHVLGNVEQLRHYVGILQQLQQMQIPEAQWADVVKTMYQQSVPQDHKPEQRHEQRRRSRSPETRHERGPERRRSPVRRDSPSQNQDKISFTDEGGTGMAKWVEYDNSLPRDHIKVLSRTLFVGGCTCSQIELEELFGRFGPVQTVIAHSEKRHAFVKMCRRKDAEAARHGLDNPAVSQGKLRSVKWGVGFGPRECNDYQTGVAIIPIARLTDADKKWITTAPLGGSGGKPLTGGLCCEEPDIEIGAGVSSKALSDRAVGSGAARREQQMRDQQSQRGFANNPNNPNNIPTGPARGRAAHSALQHHNQSQGQAQQQQQQQQQFMHAMQGQMMQGQGQGQAQQGFDPSQLLAMFSQVQQQQQQQQQQPNYQR